MPKLKTNSSAKKRFKGTRMKCRRANRNHILTKKSTSRKRNLRTPNAVNASDERAIKRLLNRA